ncbi:MAG: DUF1257 domain-containing protein [Planctomycetia bacterium]|nr:DUF1257 domain-containing protein [Planctomycetia bacterium]
MSTVLIVAPIIMTNWPLIAAAVTGALCSSTIGFAEASQAAIKKLNSENQHCQEEEISFESSEILASAANLGESLTVEKDGVFATFHRSTRGELRLAMRGIGKTKQELRQIGQDLIGRVTQQYAYHRLVTEMKNRNMSIVEETVEADETVKIRVRNW